MKKQKTIKQRLNKTLLVARLLVCLIGGLKAQDKIILTNGEEILAKVTEITDTEIKYKRITNIDGPSLVINKSNVFLINYANGSQEIVDASTKKNKAPRTDDVYRNPTTESTNGQLWKPSSDDFLPESTKKFGGPRVGLTLLSSGTLADEIALKGKRPILTQFGWQFEQRIFTIDNGTSGIVEFIPLIAGMEQGLFLPSANLLIGLRGGGKQSIEVALGPNVSLLGLGMVFAAGTNFYSGGINFPLNIAVVPSIGSIKDVHDPITGQKSSYRVETGWRITLTVGFNSRKK
jgi:hypothetical protein